MCCGVNSQEDTETRKWNLKFERKEHDTFMFKRFKTRDQKDSEKRHRPNPRQWAHHIQHIVKTHAPMKPDHVQCRHPQTLSGSINAGFHHFSCVRTATAYTPVFWWLTSLQHQSFMAQDWVLFLSNLSERTSKWFCKKHRQLGIG